jgi:HAD superfamily hydrolase (TIGR01490 family)
VVPGAAAFFDLDKTIIARSSTLAFSRPLYKAGLLNRRSLLKAAIAQTYYQMFGADHSQLERMREELSRLTKGWSKAEIESLVHETVDEVVAPLVYAEALSIIDQHQRAGRRVYVISSSPLEIVEPLSRYLGLEDVIATRPEIDDDGRYTGAIEFHAYGPGKAEAMRAVAARDRLSLADSFAYSDSFTDRPMMEAVGHPVAVNPDRELRQLAIERGWEILEFEKPIDLRSRIQPKPVLAGAAAAGAVAAITVWAIRNRRHRLGGREA